MENLDRFKKEISEIGRRLYDKGFAAGTSGNISVRCGDFVLITPSGACLGELDYSDIVIIDMNDHLLEEDKKPSSERKMHLEIYKARADISSIVHCHPPKSTSFAVAGIPLNMPTLSEIVVVLGSVPIAEYATPSSDKLAEIVAGYFYNHDAVLMANHGVVTGGKNLKEAYYKLETLELYAEISLWTKLLGNSNMLSVDNIQELNKIREKML